MPRMLLNVLVFVCIVKFANSSDNDKSIETKKENKVAKYTDIITKPAMLVKGMFKPFLNRKGIFLAVLLAGMYYFVAHERPIWAKGALDFIDYDGTTKKFGTMWSNLPSQIREVFRGFSPTFAALFSFLFVMTFRFGQWGFPATNSVYFLLLWVVSLSSSGSSWLMKYTQGIDTFVIDRIGGSFGGSSVATVPFALSVLFLFCAPVFLFSAMKFQYSIEDYMQEQKRKRDASPVQTIKTLSDEPKPLNSSTTENPLLTEKPIKQEDVSLTEQKKKPKGNVPANKKVNKPPPKKVEEGINWVAWVPIIIACVFVVGIVVGICYYKFCKNKSELAGSDIDPHDVAAMQKYEARRNTRNEFSQKF